MPAKPKHQIIETAHHAKGIDSLSPEKQDALIQAFGFRVNSLNMSRIEKLGFVDARLTELSQGDAIEKLSHSNNELFERIASALDVAPLPADPHWMERVQHVRAVENKIASLGL